MQISLHGKNYNYVWQDRRYLRGSTIEVLIDDGGMIDPIMIVFCADYSSDLFVDVLHTRVPTIVVETAIAVAKERLPEPLEDWDNENNAGNWPGN